MHTRPKSSDHRVATMGIDVGKNKFHLVGLDKRGTVVLRTELSHSQFARRLANVQRCLVGLEAGCGAHHIAPTDQRRTGKVSKESSSSPTQRQPCRARGSLAHWRIIS